MRTHAFSSLPFSVRALAVVTALGMAGALAPAAWSQPAAAAPATTAKAAAPAAKDGSPDMVVVEEDVLLFTPVQGTEFLNGGVGKEERAKMRQAAASWPLRMSFSERHDDELVAGVGLKVFNQRGDAVLRLKDAGPLTYAKVPQGNYRITARFKGGTLTRTVHVGPKGSDVAFHWRG